MREQAEAFLGEIDQEEYLHFAGHKPTFELEPIYERHADMTTLETAHMVGAAVDGRHNLELWRFVCEGYVGSLTREHEERIAGLEASLETSLDGETIGYRMLAPRIANEPDRATRRRLEEAREQLNTEHLEEPAVALQQARQRGARDLGAASYEELYRDRFGFDLHGLAEQCRELLDSTERLYEERLDRELRATVGVGLTDAERWDTRRWMRFADWDGAFPAARMLPALRASLGDLGLDLDRQPNIHLDVEQRPTKLPRAFCSPIEVPARVMLVIQPLGGPMDWQALFHEAGHAEHFAGTSRDLPFEARRLGDYAVTETHAALFERLVAEPSWLRRLLDFARPADYAATSATRDLFLLRRYAAKLLYEVELHAAHEPLALRTRYVELLGDALKFEPSPTDWLADVDSAFYATAYLRSWAGEAQLRSHLRERWGAEWFTRREAGSFLRELWELGQGPTADELIEDATGAGLELAAAEARVREALG